MRDHTWNVSMGPLKGRFYNVTSARPRCRWEDHRAPATAARVVPALSESAGARKLVAFGGRLIVRAAVA